MPMVAGCVLVCGRINQDAVKGSTMAKGQMRSNKETRKPKADKAKAVAPATVPGKFAPQEKNDGKKK